MDQIPKINPICSLWGMCNKFYCNTVCPLYNLQLYLDGNKHVKRRHFVNVYFLSGSLCSSVELQTACFSSGKFKKYPKAWADTSSSPPTHYRTPWLTDEIRRVDLAGELSACLHRTWDSHSVYLHIYPHIRPADTLLPPEPEWEVCEIFLCVEGDWQAAWSHEHQLPLPHPTFPLIFHFLVFNRHLLLCDLHHSPHGHGALPAGSKSSQSGLRSGFEPQLKFPYFTPTPTTIYSRLPEAWEIWTWSSPDGRGRGGRCLGSGSRAASMARPGLLYHS